MRHLVALLALLALCGPLAVAGQEIEDAPPWPASPCLGRAPCGYITPFVDLEFPDKPRCPGLPGEIDPAQCIPLPEVGATVRYNGTVQWYWPQSDDLVYPPDPNEPITITFAPIETNPSWLSFDVQPASYTITAADLLDPRNVRNETSNGATVIYYWFEQPVEVAFTRSADPVGDESTKLMARDGIQPVYVQVRSTGSGTFYLPSFGGEQFRFNGTGLLEPALEETMGANLPWHLGLAAVAMAVAARRQGRRTD